MIDSKIMETTKSILKEFGNTYFSDKGTLKRNKVIEDLDAYTPMLMKALLANQLIHDTYTEPIVIDDKGVEIFKLNQFIEMFTYKEYWQDSYTKFENKIGLTAGGKFIDETADVVLDFPFKDTVLKAGMTKEDQKDADEPFLHETIAKAEIDQLLEPKIFVNATKYDQENLDGVSTDNFDDDNLIIKGNNLITLHSLTKQYNARIKMIYLDPPYNTGKNSFGYNDSFTKSAWLTFMKNRLEVAKQLLRNDGIIYIQIDTSRANSSTIQGSSMEPYLHVLLDSVFGSNNYLGTLHWKKKKQPSFLSRIAGVMEEILVYAKDESNIEKLIGGETSDTTKRVDNNSNPESTMVIGKGIKYAGPEKDLIIKAGSYKNKTMSTTYLNDVVIKNFIVQNDFQATAQFRTSQKEINKFVENRLLYITSAKSLRRFTSKDELGKGKAITDLLLDSGQNQDATLEIKSLFNGDKIFETPKPEKLLQTIINSYTKKNEIVLDFFMGSATTQAVAMKMNRRFIGIEQMDYIKTVSVERLKKVIAGEQGGISKDVNWQGGGSFVYAELMEKNQGYLKDVQQAETTKQLEDVVNRMIEGGADFDFRVDVEKVLQDPEYQAMALADKKQLMVKVIDKNQLYYAYSDMEDRDVQELMSESDIAFNKSFYGERDL